MGHGGGAETLPTLHRLYPQARPASAYERPFLFVEIGAKEGEWDIIFSNTRAAEVAGALCWMLKVNRSLNLGKWQMLPHER